MADTTPITAYDLFLSYAIEDSLWVQTLHTELESRGLRVFLDKSGIHPADNFVLVIDEALRGSRFLAVVLSQASAQRPWVIYEWTTFRAQNGPLGRVIPISLEPLTLPTGLMATQFINARDRNASRVADELLETIGRMQDLSADDPRLRTIGQELTFVLSSAEQESRLDVVMPDERRQSMPTPWRNGGPIEIAIGLFHELNEKAILTNEELAQIRTVSEMVGKTLFRLLFDERGEEALFRAIEIGHTPPVITLLTDEDSLQAIPWELIHDGERFLIASGRVDLLRCNHQRGILHETIAASRTVQAVGQRFIAARS